MTLAEGKLEKGVLTASLIGHIDSGNAAQAERELTVLRRDAPEAPVVLDMDRLTYISSAGLRIILRLRKERPELRLVNVPSGVYEILEMTGFTEMMPVEKAYRRLSVDGCEVIGRGANGEVYRLDADTIVKVYLNPDSLPDIRRERELARRAFVLGVPTAIPYDVVRVGEGYGSVFELLNAKSLAKLIAEEPEKLDEHVQAYVDLLKKIHATEVRPGDMPDMKAVALDWADFLRDHLPAEQYEKLRRAAADQVENVRRYTQDARRQLNEGWDATRSKAKDLHHAGEEYVKANPTASVLGALGVGLLLGLLLGGRR